MKKNLLLMSLLLLISVSAISQTEKIVLTTAKTIGSTIKLNIYAKAAYQADAWIDLNNNQIKDDGESLTFSVGGVSTGYINLTIESQTITIYGSVYRCECFGNLVTSFDTSNNQTLNNLQCYNNMISGANMTTLVNSLASTYLGWNRTLVLIDTQNPNEQNSATTSDVQIALDKYWNVKDRNGGTLIDYNGITTAVEALGNNSALKIWSTKGLLNINAPEKSELNIFNLLGQQVYRQQMKSASVSVPLRQGIYTVRVNNMTKKVIVN